MKSPSQAETALIRLQSLLPHLQRHDTRTAAYMQGARAALRWAFEIRDHATFATVLDAYERQYFTPRSAERRPE